MGLRSRIMLLVAIGLLAATVPVGVMGLGMVRAVTDRVLEERLTMTRATAELLGERLTQGWRQLDLLGARAGVHLTAGDPAAIRQDFVGLLSQPTLFSGGLFLVDRSGRVIVQEPASSGVRLPMPAEDATLQTVLTSGRPLASSVVRVVGGGAVVLFVAPVKASSDRVIGAVGGIIDLTKPTLLAFISGLAQGISGHAAIVGHDGMVLASTDPDEFLTRNEHPAFFHRFIAQGRPLVGPTEEDRGHREVHVMAFAPIPSVPWGLGVGQNEQETFGPIRWLQDRILLFEGIALLAALAFAWLDTSAVAAPLRLLQTAAGRIASGDLEQPVDVRRNDEIGMLARRFETMRLQLRRSLEENTRLQERLLSVAMLEERERIAREMHDNVGQVLGYVNTKAQAVKALLEAGDAAGAQRHLGQLEQAARDVYTDLREAILSLRTATSPDRRLVPALREYTRRFSEMSGIPVELVADSAAETTALTPTTELHLIRIVQEALANVRKHAAARRVAVGLTQADGALLLTVADDGVGFDLAPAPGGIRFGLQTMRERAEAIGAVFTIRSAAGTGTEVSLRLPLPERRAAGARAAGG